MFGKTGIAKVTRYFKKNGILNTFFAVIERVFFAYHKNYTYQKPDVEKEEMQRRHGFKENRMFSIVVPTYETNETHLKEMIESVLCQTYKNWELILADASQSSKVETIVKTYKDERIVYSKLAKNAGISENTNVGILAAKGEYIGLLDHDDLLTADALFEVARKIEEENNAGKIAKLIFSDEDKCNGDGTRFFEPHYKPGFNRGLLYTNNYICHFMVCEAKLMKELLLRKEYDGAQDFDFALRVAKRLSDEEICHISKVLYHWRCHENSTAANPESKMYAYEAGKRAVTDAFKKNGWKVEAVHGKHLGFYKPDVKSKEELFLEDKNIGCIGGAVYKCNKVIGGAMDRAGNIIYKGLHKRFEGYMNRAHLLQSAQAVDVRNILVRDELLDLYKEMVTDKMAESGADYMALSLEFSKKVREKGYEIIYWEP